DTLNPPVGNHYFRYKVVAVDKYGDSSVFSDFMAIRGTASWLPVEPNINEIPSKFSVTNYPNPFNPSTVIKYELPQKTFVTVNVYNILGEQVVTLVNNEFKQAGRYYIAFNGTNLSSGIYFYSITAGDYRESRKMVLVK
ncbi:MAG TPA: T9SS type A sorting domain-containing protein, partial [Ignavibacteria bacterium]|nr:T9SS type A sorting domain-containing protein [Ignavibacteria bacterium]